MTILADARHVLPAHAEVPRMREEPRFADSLDLVELPTAVAVARLFVAGTLRKWHARFVEPDMEAVTAELVALAVADTGPIAGTSWTDIHRLSSIQLRLLGYQRRIVIEVADEHREALVLPDDSALSEGSGLGLVDARAQRWDSYLTLRGRVVWAELAVYERTSAGLPRRTSRPPQTSSSSLVAHAPDFLQRVRDGLERL